MHANALETVAACGTNQTLVAHRIQDPASFSASSFLKKIYRRRYIIILDLYFSYLFPWKNRGGIHLWKAKFVKVCVLFTFPGAAFAIGFDLIHPETEVKS